MPLHHRRFRGFRLRTVFGLLIAVLPVGCAPSPPPPPPAAAEVPLPPPPPPVVHRVLAAAWAFQTNPTACLAVARAGVATLEVAIRPQGPIRLTVRLPGDIPDRPAAHFNGPAGRWLISGNRLGHEAVFALDRTDTALSRVLLLLSGGTLALEPSDAHLPTLSLPESGASGQGWFVCARRSVTGT